MGRHLHTLVTWWLRRVAPAEWAESVMGDLQEEDQASASPRVGEWTTWQVARVAVRLSAERLRQRVAPVRTWSPPATSPRGDWFVVQFWRDVRLSARGWMRTPTAALTVIVTLAIGIGGNAAVFSVVNGVLLRPLPYTDPAALVTVARTGLDDTTAGAVSSAQYGAWAEQPGVLASTAAYQIAALTVTAVETLPAQVKVARTSASLFDVLGVPPALGRSLSRADEELTEHPSVVVSWRFFQQRLNGSPAALGRSVMLDGRPHEVVGVMPREFDFPGDIDAWLAINPLGSRLRGLRLQFDFLTVVARLAPTISAARAGAALDAVTDDSETSGGPRDRRTHVVPLLDTIVQPVRPMLLLAAGAVGLVLLMACANVASLLVVRATGRRRELAIRRALGAGTRALLRETMADAVVLTAAGSVLGTVLAGALIPFLRLALPDDFPRIASIALDARVLTALAGLSVLTAIAFAVGPAWIRLRTPAMLALKDSSRGVLAIGSRRSSSRSWVVSGQMALCVVLLSATALLVGNFLRLTWIDRGFVIDDMHIATVMPLLTSSAPLPTGTQGPVPLQGVIDQLRARGDVAAAALADGLPLDDFGLGAEFLVEGTNPTPRPRARIIGIGPYFFGTLGVRIIRGRALANDEVRSALGVAVVNETLANTYFRDGAIGRYIIVGPRAYEVVGIAADLRAGVGALPQGPTVYRPIDAGIYDMGGANFVTPTHLLVRGLTGTDPSRSIRDAVDHIAGAYQLTELTTLRRRLWSATADARFYSWVFGLFAIVGVLLASIGIYGLTAHLVTAGTHEIAVRLALGADRTGVIGLVVTRGLRAALWGAAAGLGASTLVNPLLAGLVVGLSPQEPIVYLAVVTLAALTTLTASLIPALAATRIVPMLALKNE